MKKRITVLLLMLLFAQGALMLADAYAESRRVPEIRAAIDKTRICEVHPLRYAPDKNGITPVIYKTSPLNDYI